MNEDFSSVLNSFSEILKEKNIDLNNIIGGENPPNSSSDDDFSIDIDTILKIKNILGHINSKNNPRNQLLHSLKPYLEDTKKEKLEQYIKIANLLSALDSMDNNPLSQFKFLSDSNYDFILMLILFLLIL